MLWRFVLGVLFVVGGCSSGDGGVVVDGPRAPVPDLGADRAIADLSRDLADARVPDAVAPVRVLFIRGGPGTGGFLEGGSDEQLSDITNAKTAKGNHGWAELAAELRGLGLVLEQRIEGPAGNNTPVPLSAVTLARYRVVVFGSNNADYDKGSVDALEAWVRAGGGALFISDANWGRDWPDASASDQRFLDRFDLRMNQDHGAYARAASSYVVPTHPILAGVKSFDGEGVTPVTVTDLLPGVKPRVLVPAQGKVRRGSAKGPGPLTDATAADAALAVVEPGKGRVACHFDRNTFFNVNGAGTSLSRLDNRRYARNLFRWLAGL